MEDFNRDNRTLMVLWQLASTGASRRAALLLLRYRVLSLVGLALVLWSLSLYVSYENRPVLGRWSYEFTAVFVLLALAWTGYPWYALHRGKSQVTESTPGRLAAAFCNLGVLLWGIAYLLSELDARPDAARLLDGNLVGSSAPLPAMLEWVAMIAFLGAATAMAMSGSMTSSRWWHSGVTLDRRATSTSAPPAPASRTS